MTAMNNCRLERRSNGQVIGYICMRSKKFCTLQDCEACGHFSEFLLPTIKTEDAAGYNLRGPQVYRPLDQDGNPAPLVLPRRSALADLEMTLPPAVAGRDRRLLFEPDGTIVYEQEEGDEPPNDINGYQRDPENPFRFTLLWLPCQLRIQNAVRYADCGCINVIMRCNNPAIPLFGELVTHTQCQCCPERKPWEEF